MAEYLKISERSIQRWQKKGITDRRKGSLKNNGRALTKEEREEIYRLCCSEKYMNLNPHEVYISLLDKGIYYCSESTLYRILREHNAVKHRAETKEGTSRKKPDELKASRPNMVWMWDITWMKSSVTGIYYYAYVILDLYDRSVIAWAIYNNESEIHSAELFRDACRKHNAHPDFVHSDNGHPMKGVTLVGLFYSLGIVPSYSRPRVSDDNPYIESFFKTVKYTRGYPRYFDTIEDARMWFADFVYWYNNEHWHSGMDFITPMQKRKGEHIIIFKKRNETLLKAKESYPLRWGKRDTRKFIVPEFEVLNPKKTA